MFRPGPILFSASAVIIIILWSSALALCTPVIAYSCSVTNERAHDQEKIETTCEVMGRRLGLGKLCTKIFSYSCSQIPTHTTYIAFYYTYIPPLPSSD